MNWDNTQIIPRLERHEEVVSCWRYEGAYAFYKPAEPFCAVHPDRPIDSGSFAWVDAAGNVLGHISYGLDGRIPTEEGYPYSGDFLDVGLGLRPDLCGRGFGRDFVRLCLRFGQEQYGTDRFRLLVAAFNTRAVKVYQRAGFSIVCEVTNAVFRNKFYIMTGTYTGA